MPKWAETLLVIGVVLAVVLCAPLWMPAALIRNAIGKQRLRNAANRFACVKCGKILGAGAVARADEVWSEHMEELRRENSGVKFRMVRTLDAICLVCGTEYMFKEKEQTFAVEEQLPTRERA